MASYNYKGQVALVTGAASGIGLATAELFAKSGAAVVLADVDEQRLHAVAAKMQKHGHEVLAVKCDVSKEEEVKQLVEQTVTKFGKLDMAYNNAGVQAPFVEFADADADDYDFCLGVNVRGVWNCMKYELQQMRKQGSGAIVNCSSMSGLIGQAGRGIYNASKHGVIGLTRSAGVEYASRNIRINAVCPGTIHTPMVDEMLKTQADVFVEIVKAIPAGRMGTAEEVAEAVAWLCSPNCSFTNGAALTVDGGSTVV